MKTTGKNGKSLAAQVREAWGEVGLFGTDDQDVQKWLAAHCVDSAYGDQLRRLIRSTHKKLAASVKREDCCDECGSSDLWEAIGFVNEDNTQRTSGELNAPTIVVCYDCQAVRVD